MMNDQNLNCAVTDVSLHDKCKKGFVGISGSEECEENVKIQDVEDERKK